MKIGNNPNDPYICLNEIAWLKYKESVACPSKSNNVAIAAPIMTDVPPNLLVGIIL